MTLKEEWKPFAGIISVFAFFYLLPISEGHFTNPFFEAIALVQWYAREHVILCLVPAMFIAGAISVFVSQASVIKYFGARAKKILAYSVASVSGSVLAVCSCTILPLFAGIYTRGAGIGPATAFLYAGPAINILAIIMTGRILGLKLGIARALGAIVFSIVIGLMMHLIYRKEEKEKADAQMLAPEVHVDRPLWQNALYFASMVGILVFANWAEPQAAQGMWYAIYSVKWIMVLVFSVLLGAFLVKWYGVRRKSLVLVLTAVAVAVIVLPQSPVFAFIMGVVGLSIVLGREKGELNDWLGASWDLAKQIMPLLFYGVLAAGFFLGRPGQEGTIPSGWIASLVGGNSLSANLFASIVGAFMYFATLTEVPILQGLIGSGMGKGPALALLLAGPAISLPSMLVLKSVMGIKKTGVFIGLVVLNSTIAGMIYGSLF
ncbi:permease [Elusimicrobiota bacterium]